MSAAIPCARGGVHYQAAPFGKVLLWPEDDPDSVTALRLEVPHFPPPVFVCWLLAAGGLLGAMASFSTAVRVDELRQLRGKTGE